MQNTEINILQSLAVMKGETAAAIYIFIGAEVINSIETIFNHQIGVISLLASFLY